MNKFKIGDKVLTVGGLYGTIISQGTSVKSDYWRVAIEERPGHSYMYAECNLKHLTEENKLARLLR